MASKYSFGGPLLCCSLNFCHYLCPGTKLCCQEREGASWTSQENEDAAVLLLLELLCITTSHHPAWLTSQPKRTFCLAVSPPPHPMCEATAIAHNHVHIINGFQEKDKLWLLLRKILLSVFFRLPALMNKRLGATINYIQKHWKISIRVCNLPGFFPKLPVFPAVPEPLKQSKRSHLHTEEFWSCNLKTRSMMTQARSSPWSPLVHSGETRQQLYLLTSDVCQENMGQNEYFETHSFYPLL